MTGPDNEWAQGERWSQRLAARAAELGVDAHYVGRLSDEELRSRVYGGDSVVVIPSRTDTFNYVALEATRSGCPVLLSERTGAHAFFAKRHPALAPISMDPDAPAQAATALQALLEDFAAQRSRLRQSLARHGFPAPRTGFMHAVYAARRSPWQLLEGYVRAITHRFGDGR